MKLHQAQVFIKVCAVAVLGFALGRVVSAPAYGEPPARVQPDTRGRFTGYFITSDSERLAYLRTHASKKVRACVLVLPGSSESVYFYRDFFKDLAHLGITSFGLDPRKFGGSPASAATAGVVTLQSSDSDLYVRDTVEFATKIVAPACHLNKIYVVGHEAGGAIALGAALQEEHKFDGVALLAPLLGFNWGTYPELQRWLMGLGTDSAPAGMLPAPAQRYGKLEDSLLTQSRQRHHLMVSVARNNLDLLRSDPSKGWVLSMHALFEKIWKSHRLDRTRVPVLMLQSGNDDAVSNQASDAYCHRIEKCKRVVVQGAKHHLLFELDDYRAPVFTQLLNLMDLK